MNSSLDSILGYRESSTVRYRKIDGCGVVMDFRTQRYSILDDLATDMWTVVTNGVQAQEKISHWAIEYDVTVDEIVGAIEEFCAERVEMGWLCRSDDAEPRQFVARIRHFPRWWRRLPGGFLAFAALISTSLSLRFRGFSKTYDRAGMARLSRRAVPPLEPVVRAFLAAENLMLFTRAPNDCLVRSLALYRYLGWRGVPAAHVIGIRRAPFSAHAWVEVAGKGVLAPAPRGFAPLATLTSTLP